MPNPRIITETFSSPLGEILLAADEVGLIGLWLPGQKYFANNLTKDFSTINLKKHKNNDIFPENPKALSQNPEIIMKKSRQWLNIYFNQQKPDFCPPIHFIGTEFQRRVWRKLLEIPYGQTTTYGEIAKSLHSSARAVGGAVGRNPVSIIAPCHRVIGASGQLTGYAGGLDLKTALLKLEGIIDS